MKKSLSVFIVAIMLFLGASSFTACGEAVDIGVCLTDTSTTLSVSYSDAIKEKFSDYNVSVQSADGNATTQLNQINAFVTMKVKMIIITPVETGSVVEALKKARISGIKVVVSGVNSEEYGDDFYDAVTVSDEYLIGSYVALLAKHWAEENLAGKTFDTVICYSDLQSDAIKRSNGLRSITEPYLLNTDGQYVDYNGKVVTESEKVKNPCYCELVANNPVHEVLEGLDITSGTTYMSNILTQYPNTKLVLMYMSGWAPTMSQYIVDNGQLNKNEFALFGGGVQGNECAYLAGSLPNGVGEVVLHAGKEYKAVNSVFRGAVSFGGSNAAESLANICYSVFSKTEGQDFQKKTTEGIGVWYTYEADGEVKDTLAVISINQSYGSCASDFEEKAMLEDSRTTIKWQGK